MPVLVIPLKPAAVGKSRLGGGAELARAIALDTVEAAARAAQVRRLIVVTADTTIAGELFPLFDHGDVIIEPEPAGITAAIARGFERTPLETFRAVLLGDLPGLQPGDLDVALTLAADAERGFVRDADGSGTTLVSARSGVAFEEHFGPGSAEAHRAAGFAELAVPAGSSVRYDVDDAEQLEALASRRLGPRTTAVLAAR